MSDCPFRLKTCREDCAWFNKGSKQCHIIDISEHLWRINYTLEGKL